MGLALGRSAAIAAGRVDVLDALERLVTSSGFSTSENAVAVEAILSWSGRETKSSFLETSSFFLQLLRRDRSDGIQPTILAVCEVDGVVLIVGWVSDERGDGVKMTLRQRSTS